jgi:hypothetical protein
MREHNFTNIGCLKALSMTLDLVRLRLSDRAESVCLYADAANDEKLFLVQTIHVNAFGRTIIRQWSGQKLPRAIGIE